MGSRRYWEILFIALCAGVSVICALMAPPVPWNPPAVSVTAVSEVPTAFPPITVPPDTPAPVIPTPEMPVGEPIDPVAVRIAELLEEMSLRERVYQLFFVSPDRIGRPELLELFPVGGMIFLEKHISEPEQIRTMIADYQSSSKIPLFISADEEGGRVSRLHKLPDFTRLGAMYSYRARGSRTAYSNAYDMALSMASYGFNMDFAPVADVWSNPQNTVIGDRAYSDSFEEAALLVPAAVRGFRDGGLICSIKHFPGHGSTALDTHDGNAYVDKSWEQLMSEELLPFVAGIEEGADMVMVGHMIVSHMDSVQATLSETVVTQLLRGELGFDGVVITDAMNMRALSEYSVSESAVMAVRAGIDLLLEPGDLSAAADGIIAAVDSGELSAERIDASVSRILRLKLERGLIAMPTP